MFRLMLPRPPHGWNAVVWELVIVTIGVLMALGLQELVEKWASRSRSYLARQAISQELREHFLNAVEWRVLSPCIVAQLDQIDRRIENAKDRIQPLTANNLDGLRVTVMAPRRIYNASSWQGAVSEGTVFSLTDTERKQLANENSLSTMMTSQSTKFADNDAQLLAAARPLELDPGVRLSLVQSLDRMRTGVEMMDRTAAEILFWVRIFGAAPTRADTQAELTNYSGGLISYCRRESFPTRSLTQALDPNSK